MEPQQDVIELPNRSPLRDRLAQVERERDALKVQLDGWNYIDAKKLRAQRDQLRAAMVKLVGVDGRVELEQMEVAMRLMPAPAEDKAATVDAIHALLATLEDR